MDQPPPRSSKLRQHDSAALRLVLREARYRNLSREETARLLRKYWNIPERQIESSVVLASPAWQK